MSKKEEIIRLRKAGYSINNIVSELHCAKSTVSYYINNENLGGKIDKKNDNIDNRFLSNIDPTILIKIKELKNNGKTYNEIIQFIPISKDNLKKICRILKLNIPPRNKKIIDINEVLIFYKKSKSLDVTAKKFQISIPTLRKYYIDDDNILRKVKRISKSESVIEWRRRKKIELVEYLGGKCQICGYNNCISALQFHHKNPNEKDFTISGKSYSIEKLKKEAYKCILVCANCHHEIHEKLKNRL
jgi:predicted transcriptional regulator